MSVFRMILYSIHRVILLCSQANAAGKEAEVP